MSAPKFTPGVKPPSVEVTAYRCGTCGDGLNRTKADADKCCCCSECGTPLELDGSGYGRGAAGHRGTGKCKACCYRWWLRHKRDSVRRDQERLDSAKKDLAETEAEAALIPELAPDLSQRQRARLKAISADGEKLMENIDKTANSLLRMGLVSRENGITDAGRAALAKVEGSR